MSLLAEEEEAGYKAASEEGGRRWEADWAVEEEEVAVMRQLEEEA